MFQPGTCVRGLKLEILCMDQFSSQLKLNWRDIVIKQIKFKFFILTEMIEKGIITNQKMIAGLDEPEAMKHATSSLHNLV